MARTKGPGRLVVYTRANMGWNYSPTPPETEAANVLSAYQERLRRAELGDLLKVNLDTEPPASRRLNAQRLRNVVSLILKRLSRPRRTSDRDPSP